MKNQIREYFYYTRSERNGALILLLLILGCCLAPRYYPFLVESPADADCAPGPSVAVAVSNRTEEPPPSSAGEPFFFDPNTAGEEALLALGLPPPVVHTMLNYRRKGGRFDTKTDLQKIYGLKAGLYERLAPYVRIETEREEEEEPPPASGPETAPEAFPFDPNRAGREELLALGLPERTVNTWLNYREKGGRFHQTTDLQKIYGLREEDYDRLAPYVHIAEASPQPPRPESYEEAPPPSVDINRAGAADWERLRGIGPAYAGRILRFREALGGFSSVKQVAETYGLPDSTFQAIRPFLQLSPVYRQLAINRATAEELAAHPYLNRKKARILCDYRTHHGPYRSAEDLLRVKVLSPEEIQLLLPYLSFE